MRHVSVLCRFSHYLCARACPPVPETKGVVTVSANHFDVDYFPWYVERDPFVAGRTLFVLMRGAVGGRGVPHSEFLTARFMDYVKMFHAPPYVTFVLPNTSARNRRTTEALTTLTRVPFLWQCVQVPANL